MLLLLIHLRYERRPEPPRSLSFGETCTKAGELHLQCDCEEFDSPSFHNISICPCSSVIELSPCKRVVASLILRQGLQGAVFYWLGTTAFTSVKRVRFSSALPLILKCGKNGYVAQRQSVRLLSGYALVQVQPCPPHATTARMDVRPASNGKGVGSSPTGGVCSGSLPDRGA
jgi:hypothetical protein